MTPLTVEGGSVRLGLRANLGQFALLVGVNALVGRMVGQERTILPLLATDVFGVVGVSSALTYLVAFGVTKAGANLAAGALADRYGRKPVLVAGWLIGLPVPLLLIWAPTWGCGSDRRDRGRVIILDLAGRRDRPGTRHGARVPRPCWTPLPTSPSLPGEAPPSGHTGCGGIWALPLR